MGRYAFITHRLCQLPGRHFNPGSPHTCSLSYQRRLASREALRNPFWFTSPFETACPERSEWEPALCLDTGDLVASSTRSSPRYSPPLWTNAHRHFTNSCSIIGYGCTGACLWLSASRTLASHKTNRACANNRIINITRSHARKWIIESPNRKVFTKRIRHHPRFSGRLR